MNHAKDAAEAGQKLIDALQEDNPRLCYMIIPTIKAAIRNATAQAKEEAGLYKGENLNYREEVEFLKGQIKKLMAEAYSTDPGLNGLSYRALAEGQSEKIEDLQQTVSKLLAVIEPFAEVGDPECWDFRNSCFHRNSNKVLFGIGSREQTTKQAKVTFGDFRRAWECYQALAEIYKEVMGE